MGNLPNSAEFSVNERLREYTATIEISGEMEVNILADSYEEAYRLAIEVEAGLENGDPMDVQLDELGSVRLLRVRKEKPMFRVTRDGQPIQVSRLELGDMPRDPQPNGF